MSEESVRAALKSCYKQINTRWARRSVDKQKQIVLVSRKNLREAFIEAYYKAQDVQPELPNLDLIVFSDAGSAALEAMKRYVKTSPSTTLKVEGETFIKFTQRTGRNTMPFLRAKQAGKKVIENALKMSSSNENLKLSDEASRVVDQTVTRSHEEITVGMKILAEMFDELRQDPTLSGFASSVTATRLADKFDLELYFKKDPLVVNRYLDYKIGITVRLKVLKSSDNPKGQKAADWANIRKELEKAALSWAKNYDWPNTKASPTPTEEYSVRALNDTVKQIVRNVDLDITLPVLPKTIKAEKRAPIKHREPRDESVVNLPFSQKLARLGKMKVDPSRISLEQLMLIINEVLPDIVADNMGSPRLNYRTGRFASSVRITDIRKTKKGVPSIGYTYMKNPYQTFEPGYAQGSADRDPRTLIDLSIREAARQIITGFYTRRV